MTNVYVQIERANDGQLILVESWPRLLNLYGAVAARITTVGDIEMLVPADDGTMMWMDVRELDYQVEEIPSITN